MKTISVINQKGGVGKTTTAINLAAALAACQKKVLIIDFDPQANATTGFGCDKNDTKIVDVMLGRSSIDDAISDTDIPNLSILCGSYSLSMVEPQVMMMPNKEYILRDKIREMHTSFDVVFIDCPPSLGVLPVNALVASSSMIIPLQAEFYAIEGFSKLLKLADLVSKTWNYDLKLEGIVVTMFDTRNSICHDINKDIRLHMSRFVYQTVIPRNVKIVESQSYGKPVVLYDVQSSGSRAYIDLAREFLEHNATL